MKKRIAQLATLITIVVSFPIACLILIGKFSWYLADELADWVDENVEKPKYD